MTTTAKLAAAVAGGYLLGRTKRLRLTILIAGMLAGKKLAADPRSIANQIVDRNPELEHLREQLTGGLGEAAKNLAFATAASRMEAVTATMQHAAETTTIDQSPGQGSQQRSGKSPSGGGQKSSSSKKRASRSRSGGQAKKSTSSRAGQGKSAKKSSSGSRSGRSGAGSTESKSGTDGDA